jgi:molybdenum cofactor cytidylyltransferase
VNVGCVLLAAGAGKRFGGHKLLHKICGETMIERALDRFSAFPFCVRVCVTRPEAETIRRLAQEKCFTVAVNPNPDRGVGTSAAIGTKSVLSLCPEAEGILFAVCDQPNLRHISVQRLLTAFQYHPNRIVSLSYAGVRGNPAVFPKSVFGELEALTGDVGGGAVVRRHPEMLVLEEAETEDELIDIDTRME